MDGQWGSREDTTAKGGGRISNNVEVTGCMAEETEKG